MTKSNEGGVRVERPVRARPHKLKFKVGDKVRVIADKHAAICSHGRMIGRVYTVVEANLESREGPHASNYQEYRLSGAAKGWVCEDEIEAA